MELKYSFSPKRSRSRKGCVSGFCGFAKPCSRKWQIVKINSFTPNKYASRYNSKNESWAFLWIQGGCYSNNLKYHQRVPHEVLTFPLTHTLAGGFLLVWYAFGLFYFNNSYENIDRSRAYELENGWMRCRFHRTICIFSCWKISQYYTNGE